MTIAIRHGNGEKMAFFFPRIDAACEGGQGRSPRVKLFYIVKMENGNQKEMKRRKPLFLMPVPAPAGGLLCQQQQSNQNAGSRPRSAVHSSSRPPLNSTRHKGRRVSDSNGFTLLPE